MLQGVDVPDNMWPVIIQMTVMLGTIVTVAALLFEGRKLRILMRAARYGLESGLVRPVEIVSVDYRLKALIKPERRYGERIQAIDLTTAERIVIDNGPGRVTIRDRDFLDRYRWTKDNHHAEIVRVAELIYRIYSVKWVDTALIAVLLFLYALVSLTNSPWLQAAFTALSSVAAISWIYAGNIVKLMPLASIYLENREPNLRMTMVALDAFDMLKWVKGAMNKNAVSELDKLRRREMKPGMEEFFGEKFWAEFIVERNADEEAIPEKVTALTVPWSMAGEIMPHLADDPYDIVTVYRPGSRYDREVVQSFQQYAEPIAEAG